MKNSVSSKLPLILVIFLVIAIAVATVLENRYGTHYALQHVYGAWWFVCLWAMLALAGCWLMYKRKMWKQPSVMLLHLSFLVILLGALATYLTSHKGMVHLREGETCRTYWVKNEQGLYTQTEQMPFYLALKKFRILYDAQTSFDDDLGGSVFTISYDPWGTAITYAGYLLLAISMIWVSFSKVQSSKFKVQSSETEKNSRFSILNSQFSTALLAFCGIAMASYMVIAICRSPLVPILRSPFLVVHVGTIMLSYILLVVSILRREVLRPAVFLLATGIFLGAVWANVSWGTYWSWDPKESWALITLLVYSVPLHSKSLPWFNSMRNYRIYSLLAFACLLMTYFGVNFLLGGMHSYAG